MRYLHFFNGALFALALTFAVVMAVVWLLYGIYADESMRIAADLPLMGRIVFSFCLMAIVLGASFWSQWRGLRWRWWFQAGGLLVFTASSYYLYNLLGA